MKTRPVMSVHTSAGQCLNDSRMPSSSHSLPTWPAPTAEFGEMSDSIGAPFEPTQTNQLTLDGSYVYPSSSVFPIASSNIHFSSFPPQDQEASFLSPFTSQSPGTEQSLPPNYIFSNGDSRFRNYSTVTDDVGTSWNSDDPQGLPDFSENLPFSNCRIMENSGRGTPSEDPSRWQHYLNDESFHVNWKFLNEHNNNNGTDQQLKATGSDVLLLQPLMHACQQPLPSPPGPGGSNFNRVENVSILSPPSGGPGNKARMRWTTELHDAFVEAVNHFGGSERATPKGILTRMNVEGLTIYHVKSHLQKYRTARFKPEPSEDPERSNSSMQVPPPDLKTRSIDITEALQLQMEVQKQLHQQLEIQRKLQLQIEQHGQYLRQIMSNQNKIESKRLGSSSPSTASGPLASSSGPVRRHSATAEDMAELPVDGVLDMVRLTKRLRTDESF